MYKASHAYIINEVNGQSFSLLMLEYQWLA